MTRAGVGLRPVDSAIVASRPAIRIRDLVKTFGKLTAIDRVSLDIMPGEFFMIVGPSGCGKTTLIRILAGLEEASAGTFEIDVPPDSDRPVNSMVFQGDSIFPLDDGAAECRLRAAHAPRSRRGRQGGGGSLSRSHRACALC